MTKPERRKRMDRNQLAHDIVTKATEADEQEPEDGSAPDDEE